MASKTKVIDIDNGWNVFKAQLASLSGTDVFVGVQGTEAVQRRSGGVTNAELAAIHEFGAPRAGIPSRSFLRSTFDENRTKYEAATFKAAKAVTEGSTPAAEFFKLGERVRADIIRKIKANIPPPLKASTIARKKGGTTPLIDTGVLIGAITSVVNT